MAPKISKLAAEFQRSKSPIRQIMDYARPAYFRELGLDPANVISFAGGWVAHAAPPELMGEYAQICGDAASFHQSGAYSPTIGTDDCRSVVIEFERHLYGTEGLELEQVVIGSSSTQLTTTVMRTLLDPGDRILLLDPAYCNVPLQLLSNIDVEIVRFPVLDAERWEYDDRAAEIGSFILAQKPKVVFLIAPDNPTSKILSDAFVRNAREACRSIGAFLVIDFAYKELVFRRPLPDYFRWAPDENVVLLRSNSKWCRSLGRRLGWLLAPRAVVDAIDALQSSTVLAPDTLHQMAFVRHVRSAIADGSLGRYIAEISSAYRRAAEETVRGLAANGIRHLEPEGGLYVTACVERDGATFVEETLREKSVLFVPGWGFGRSMTNGIRISFGPLVNDLERLREGLRRLGSR